MQAKNAIRASIETDSVSPLLELGIPQEFIPDFIEAVNRYNWVVSENKKNAGITKLGINLLEWQFSEKEQVMATRIMELIPNITGTPENPNHKFNSKERRQLLFVAGSGQNNMNKQQLIKKLARMFTLEELQQETINAQRIFSGYKPLVKAA